MTSIAARLTTVRRLCICVFEFKQYSDVNT